MHFQFLLSIAALAGILPALSLPLQYTDAAEIEVRSTDNEASLVSRGYLDLDLVEREFDTSEVDVLVRRAGKGGRGRGVPPPIPPHNSHEAAQAAYHATANKPGLHDTFHTTTGAVFTGEHVHQAIQNFHLHDPTPGGHDRGSAGHLQHPKPFKNYKNVGDRKPPFPELPSPAHGVKEFPLTTKKGGFQSGLPGVSRIMMQQNPGGGHTFLGVTSHPGELSEFTGDHLRAKHKPAQDSTKIDYSKSFQKMYGEKKNK